MRAEAPPAHARLEMSDTKQSEMITAFLFEFRPPGDMHASLAVGNFPAVVDLIL